MLRLPGIVAWPRRIYVPGGRVIFFGTVVQAPAFMAIFCATPPQYCAPRSLFYRLKTLTESSQVLFLKRKYNFFSEYANMMTAAESTDLFKAKPIVKTDPIPDSLIVLELVRKHDTPDLIESANFFISTISVGYRSLFKPENPALIIKGFNIQNFL